MAYISSTSVLPGAVRFNYVMPDAVAIEDCGGKLAMLISTVNALVSAVNVMQSALVWRLGLA